MSVAPLAIRRTGLVTSVGLSAPAACAAFRAKLTHPGETRFTNTSGEWIMAHQVRLPKLWRGVTKLAKMAAMAIDEAMIDVPRPDWAAVPLLLCVAEADRPGRSEGIDGELFGDIEAELDARFHARSGLISRGRVGVAVALAQARVLLQVQGIDQVLVAATDSLINEQTLGHYEEASRLLTSSNSNGFMPGEGAGALRVARPVGGLELVVSGIGFAIEKASLASDQPLRADGLVQAMRGALNEADLAMHDVDYRIADLSGEQYYFKEAALALSRTLRRRKEEFDLWHPAECTGEAGATSGVTVIALAEAAARKGYARGPTVLSHWATDAGHRAAVTLRWQGE